MRPSLRKSSALLRTLCTACPQRRRALLATLSAPEVKDISSIVLNSIRPDGGCPLSEAKRRRLRRHKDVLRRVAYGKKKGWAAQKRLIQRGGGVWLVPLLTSFLSSAVGSLLG